MTKERTNPFIVLDSTKQGWCVWCTCEDGVEPLLSGYSLGLDLLVGEKEYLEQST